MSTTTLQRVIKKHGLVFNNDELGFVGGGFLASYFETGGLNYCCAVKEFGELEMPYLPLTPAEHKALFTYQVRKVLEYFHRNQAIITTAGSQTKTWRPLLKAAGFVDVGTSVNPGSGNKVTIWVLSI